MTFSYAASSISLTLPTLIDGNLQKLLNFIRVPNELMSGSVPIGTPCFIINATEEIIESVYKSYGFIEVLDFIKNKLARDTTNA